MNRFISPTGLIRFAGAAALGSMLAVVSYVLRAGSPVDQDETYTFFMGLGLWTAIGSLTILGVGLLVARPAAPESEHDQVDQIDQVDHWA